MSDIFDRIEQEQSQQPSFLQRATNYLSPAKQPTAPPTEPISTAPAAPDIFDRLEKEQAAAPSALGRAGTALKSVLPEFMGGTPKPPTITPPMDLLKDREEFRQKLRAKNPPTPTKT